VTLKFELSQDFCTMHLPTKFHHPMFNHSEIIMMTNKQTNKQTNRCHTKHPLHSAMLCQYQHAHTSRWVLFHQPF